MKVIRIEFLKDKSKSIVGQYKTSIFRDIQYYNEYCTSISEHNKIID